ncbi:MAG: response regulator [Rhodothermaceae bacterium]
MATKEKVNVLLIEDNPGDIRLIKEFLAAREEVLFIVDVARDLDDIARLSSNENYTIILCDLNLPGSNGIETFQLVHKLFNEIPIIVQTGINDKDLGKLAVSEGAQDYLQKGTFDDHLLYKAISYAIERHQLVKNLTAEIISKERAKIFEDIFENSSVGVYKTTCGGEFILANQAFVKLLGFDSF